MIRMIRKKGLIFKRQQFIFCFLIFFSISLVGENQRMSSQYGHMKRWGLKTASAHDPTGYLMVGGSLALIVYNLYQLLSIDPLILSEIDAFLEKNQLATKDFSQEEIIGIIKGFMMSLSLRDNETIKDWTENQKIGLMMLAIVLSSTQSNDKQKINILLNNILSGILDKIKLTLFTEEAGTKTKFIETIKLIALNLRKNANRNSFIKNEIVDDIERKLESTLKQIIKDNRQGQKIINEAKEVLNILYKLQNQSQSFASYLHGPDLNVETLFSGFSASGINEFINTLTKPLDEKRIIALVEGFFMSELLKANGRLMKTIPNQKIELWTKDQKTKLMILSMVLSLLISEKNSPDILLSTLGNILHQIGKSIESHKEDEKREITYQFIDTLGFIGFNLVKTNKSSVINHISVHPKLISIPRKFAEHKDPMIRSKVLEFIEKVGQINIEKNRKLNVYELNNLLMQLMEDKHSSVKEKAQNVIENLNLTLKPTCFGLFQKFSKVSP